MPLTARILPAGLPRNVYVAFSQAIKRAALLIKAWELRHDPAMRPETGEMLSDSQIDQLAGLAEVNRPGSEGTYNAVRAAAARFDKAITPDTDSAAAHQAVMEIAAKGTPGVVQTWSGRPVLLIPVPLAD